MSRLICLALVSLAARLTGAAAAAPTPSVVPVPVVGPASVDRISDVHEIARLPGDVAPSRYDLTITPYFDTGDETAFTFAGNLFITLRAQVEGVQEIVLHSEDLTFTTITVTTEGSDDDLMEDYNLEAANSFLRLDLSTSMLLERDYVITAVYTGIIREDMRGFYRSWYYDGADLRWMGTTHFQPGHARKAFPSFDEPKFKAVFGIAIDRPAGYSDVLSNMPIASVDGLPNEIQRQTFHETPVMSTYLVAFTISRYSSDHVTLSGDTRPFGVHARTTAAQDGSYAFDIGQDILATMEENTEYPYYSMTDNIKMDLVAIPDHSDGAMENYGLLAYRESLILSREGKTSDYFKQRIVSMISHEVAHMWFGNLVTCEWWDNLWLNEGFARYYEMFLAHKVAPEMAFDTRFVTEHMFNALHSDSFNGMQPLTIPPQGSAIILNDYDPHSSVIAYSKGASIIRQTEHLLGETTFKAGLRIYLKARAGLTATPEHLWEHLQAAADADDALADYGITVADYFSTWSTQPGFPLLTVEVSGDIITIKQSIFNLIQGDATDWVIPITYATASEPDFLDTKPSHVMTGPSLEITKSSSADEWILFNKQATGFYRVNYDAASWDRIQEVLSGRQRDQIHPINRAYIINNIFALAMHNIMAYDRALELISWLEYEKDFAPWAAAIDSVDYLRGRVLSVNEALTALDAHVIKLASALVDEIGFDDVDGEDFMVSFTRHTVAPCLCRAGHPACIDAAVSKFAQFREDGVQISPNSRPWVYCNALRHGTVEDFTFLWDLYLAEDVSNEKQVILEALGCTPHEETIVTFLNHITSYTLDPDGLTHAVRTQDTLTAFDAALSSNVQNAVYAFEWFKVHWKDLANRLESPTYAFQYFGRSLYVSETVSEYMLWVETHVVELGSYGNAASHSTVYATSNLNWIQTPERLNALIRFFDLDIELITPAPTIQEPDTAPQPATEPDISLPLETTSGAPGSSPAITAGLVSVSIAMLFQVMVLY